MPTPECGDSAMSSQPGVKEFSAERQLRARRPQKAAGATNDDLLRAIESLRDEIKALTVAAPEEAGAPEPGADADLTGRAARVEIAQMVRIIGQAKMEISAIRHPKSDDDRMQAATSELDAIVLATETSTQDVLSAAEQIEKIVRQMSGKHPDDQELGSLSEDVADEIIKIFEACNFQDITGQRITKVVRTIRFIEERILAIIGIWGAEAFAALPMPQTAETGDGSLMNGPQLPNHGISQDDINALFD